MRTLLALLLATAGGLSPVRFTPHAGWHTGRAPARPCPGVSAQRCSQVWSWAATTRWRDCAGCLPHRTVAALRPSGIAIQISLTNERPPVVSQRLAWPPQLTRADVRAGFEGIARRYGVYQRVARVGAYEAYVWVFFGRSDPTAPQLGAANAELRRAHLP